jgi:hypothetical protein
MAVSTIHMVNEQQKIDNMNRRKTSSNMAGNKGTTAMAEHVSKLSKVRIISDSTMSR